MFGTRLLALAVALLLTNLGTVVAQEKKEPKELPAQVSYYKDVRPIFAQHCQGCHQPARPQGGYVMTSQADLLKPGEKGKPGLVPGKPGESAIVDEIIAHGDKKPKMPKNAEPLTDYQVNLIKKWVIEGAKDDTPASAKLALVDAAHPPVYVLPPVITAVAYSPDSTLLAVSGYHEVLLHKADGSALVARLIGLSERIQSLAFSPDGKSLAVTGGSPGRFGELQVWEVASKKLKLSLSVTFDTLYGVSWSPDGNKIAFGCSDNTLRAVEALTGKQILYQGAHSDWVLSTAFSADGTYLVSVSRDRSVKLTEVATQRFIDNVTSITPGALKGGLQSVALRPFKEKKKVKAANIAIADTQEKIYDELAFGGSDGVPRLYKMHREVKRVIGDDANKVREYEALPGIVYSVSFNADGTQLAAGSSLDGKGEVRIFETQTGKRISQLEGVKSGIFTIAFRPDGKQIASAGFDGVVRLNDPATGKLIKEFVPVPLGASASVTKSK
jgi:WD40 repeat protein/mono/diheme cytochrome c family protein